MSQLNSYDSSFELLGGDPVVVYLYQMRSDLMNVVIDLIKQKRLTQNEAAKLLGVTQPRVSDLYKAKVDKFSVSMLLGMLYKLGYEFKFSHTLDKPSLGFQQKKLNKE
ncbi:MAG: helix-turn-helix domain-containing protein [Proteobacteria bacterium]|nr:helix-turn-helix domain-containing protein [Pseudomonadota bacterium]